MVEREETERSIADDRAPRHRIPSDERRQQPLCVV